MIGSGCLCSLRIAAGIISGYAGTKAINPGGLNLSSVNLNQELVALEPRSGTKYLWPSERDARPDRGPAVRHHVSKIHRIYIADVRQMIANNHPSLPFDDQ